MTRDARAGAAPADHAPADHAHPAAWEAIRGLCRIITTVGFDLKVRGIGYIPARGGALLVSNHQSNLDPVLLAVHSRRPVSFFAKIELFEVPVFGSLIRALNAFPVRRGEGDIAAVKEAIRRLQEGRVLTMFPEGTRTRTGEIGPIQPGIATIIRRGRVPVIPAVIEGAQFAWPRRRRLPTTHPIRILYGPPMKLHDYPPRDIIDVIDQTLRMMQTMVRKL
jgi:1-acyl-sn-glycerol-3-phosphate acyltransferase